MEESNANEKEWAMGFCINFIVVPTLFKGGCKWIFGQVMDLDCFTWIFNLTFGEQKHLPNHTHPLHPILHMWHL
jgi:hypothetical protein